MSEILPSLAELMPLAAFRTTIENDLRLIRNEVLRAKFRACAESLFKVQEAVEQVDLNMDRHRLMEFLGTQQNELFKVMGDLNKMDVKTLQPGVMGAARLSGLTQRVADLVSRLPASIALRPMRGLLAISIYCNRAGDDDLHTSQSRLLIGMQALALQQKMNSISEAKL